MIPRLKEDNTCRDRAPLCSDQNDEKRKCTNAVYDSNRDNAPLSIVGGHHYYHHCYRRLKQFSRNRRTLIQLLSLATLVQLAFFFNPLSQQGYFLFAGAADLSSSTSPTGQNVRVPSSDSNALESSNSFDASRTSEGKFINLERTSPSTDLAAEAASHLYDAIIVGGGAAGCPLARTLADAGKEVLLIERGGARIDHPETLDIYGAGKKIISATRVYIHIALLVGPFAYASGHECQCHNINVFGLLHSTIVCLRYCHRQQKGVATSLDNRWSHLAHWSCVVRRKRHQHGDRGRRARSVH